ncbi:MAG: NADH-quinone oxidoreductase subunit L [Bacteroidota bacterium]
MNSLAILIPVFPLVGFLILGLFGKNFSKTSAAVIASGAVLSSFILAIILFINQLENGAAAAVPVKVFDWINSGSLNISFSFLIDPLSSIFLLVITGIGFLIHLYSAGYMHDDEGHNKFFSYLNLFIFFMLLLVMGSNYLVMFVGWEGVGLCSYLLIGFWFKNTAYNNAAKKAFVMNRIGDLGFLLGIILLFINFESIDYLTVFDRAKGLTSGDNSLMIITLLLFVGAMGKSAQIPLYTWLPDAMAGPTPVSALIHAATMVTAGIYMIARSNILFALSPVTMQFIAIIGVSTALFAATIGLAQNDIKKVLAYSTVSQLGYMFLALGLGAFGSGVFHVVTHAFFKACLFLGAGSVIHAMSGEQDIRNMGGLKKYVPVTYTTFLLATIAIAGIFPFAGFFSKDEILAHAFEHNKVLWLLGLIASIFTSFYMFRLLFLTFFGEFRGTQKQLSHLHESPKSMTIPLIVLAGLSVAGGFIGIPEVFHGPHLLKEFLAPVFKASEMRMIPGHLDHTTEYALMGVAMLSAIISIYVAYIRYVKTKAIPAPESTPLKPLHKLIYNKYYIDEVYDFLITKPLNGISQFFGKILDKQVIDGGVNLTGSAFTESSGLLKYIQTGNIGFYLLAMVIGIIAILGYGLL